MGRVKFVVVGLIVVGAVGALIVTGMGDEARYYLTVEELENKGADAVGRPLTVSGAVLADTIEYDPSVPRLSFTILHVPDGLSEQELEAAFEAARLEQSTPRLDVVYEGLWMEMLRDGAEAVVRGKLRDDGRFYADEVLLKCPSRYEGGESTGAGGGP